MSNDQAAQISQWKKRVFTWTIYAVALWPLAHFGLTKILDISPWKLAGWAMYAEPSRTFSLKVESMPDGEALTGAGLEPEVRSTLMNSFGKLTLYRVQFCEWYAPDDFADAVFDVYPEVDSIRITIARFGLDRIVARRLEKW